MKLFSRSRQPAPDHMVMEPPSPTEPLYAVGDIHGRHDLLQQMMEKIDADMVTQGRDAADVVFLGDYVDRGEASADVLRSLMAVSQDFPDRVTCILGNHEQMMLDFLDAPEERGARWLRNGGLQTLASFRIGGLSERSSPQDIALAADDLRHAMGPEMIAWLRDLPLTVLRGNIVCVHAALDPMLAPDEQDKTTMIWGSRAFLDTPRRDGLWVIHGHTVVDQPSAEAGRIAVDTGAYFTGRLTAAAIFPGQTHRFVQS